MIEIEIPGRTTMRFEKILADLNGTLTRDGALVEGLAEILEKASKILEIHVVTSDTLGTAQTVLAEHPVTLHTTSGVGCREEKLALLRELGSGCTCAIGNGSNDTLMLEEAALGICVLGLEGAAVNALIAADVVVSSPIEAFEILRNPRRLRSTLRR